MLLLRDREYLPVLLRAIQKARKEIEARIFLIDPGREGKRPVLALLKALHKARQRGVRIQILTDGIFQARPSGKRLKEAARKLGLPMEWDDKSTVLHEKTVRLDGRTAFLGSHNWTTPSLLENRELSIRLSSPAPLLDAEGFSRSLLADIEKAQKEITLATFDIDESSHPYDFGTKLARALIQAKKRGLKVRVLFDSSQTRVPETGEIVYHYRGLRKADELARGGVHVYYDTTLTLFHAKIALIDDRFVYIGSQNLEIRKDVTDLEATVRLDSRKISSQVKSYLAGILRESVPFHLRGIKSEGLRLPLSFLEKNGVFNRMLTHQSEETFRLYTSLLREAWKTKSNFIEKRWSKSLFDDRRRLVRRYGVLTGTILLDPETRKPFVFPDKDFFVVPDPFFDFGWFERLRHREIHAYWIHLAEAQHSAQSPFWSLGQSDLTRKYGISRWSFGLATISLERWNLIEVIRDPKITMRNVVKRPNRYRLNPVWSLEEQALAKKKMLEELSMNPELLKEAERLASSLNQPNDLEVIRKFLLLIDRYGLEKTKRAARITARFKPHFALRNVHHTAAILRNWSQGIYK